MTNLAGVLATIALLGLAAWGAGIAVLAWVVSRGTITAGTLARAGAALAATGALYTLAVIAIRLLLPA